MLEGKPRHLEVPPIRKMLEQAEEIKRQLDEAGSNRAAVARKLHLTRPRVTQLMKLLDLHPKIREYIKSLPPGTPERMVTERGLRALMDRPQVEQIRVALVSVKGFKPFTEETRRRTACASSHAAP